MGVTLLNQLSAAWHRYWSMRWWIKWPVTVFAGLVLLAVLAPDAQETASQDATATASVEAPTQGATTVAAEATTTASTPAETTPPTPPPTPTPLPKIELSGRGDDVESFDLPGNVPAVVRFTHSGARNFAVIGYAPSGERTDLLVNTIGAYEGIRPINLAPRELTSEFEITADGPWTATIVPLAGARAAERRTEGTGDDVLRTGGINPRTARITHSGGENFVVLAWGASRNLLVNEIGPYDGRVRLANGTQVLEIQADGQWTIEFE